MFKIGNIKIKNPVVLAPMAGISNPNYMKICEEMGVGYAITELISAEAIVRNNKKTFDMLKGIDELNIPIAVQIFGSNPSVLAKASQILVNDYNVRIIDINMGCPVPKVAVKSQAGSALLKDIKKIEAIVSSVVNSVNVPVTIKMRSGWDEKSINAVEIAKVCEKCGISAIAIHARTRSQGYTGKANWDIIKEIKENVNIPVIGNGDIKSCYDAKKMMDYTLCDAVMIGRAAIGNPWLIKECVDYLENNKEPKEVTFYQKIDMMKYHYDLLLKTKGEAIASIEIRSFILYYLKGLPQSKEIKNKICSTKSAKEIFELLNEYKKELEKDFT